MRLFATLKGCLLASLFLIIFSSSLHADPVAYVADQSAAGAKCKSLVWSNYNVNLRNGCPLDSPNSRYFWSTTQNGNPISVTVYYGSGSCPVGQSPNPVTGLCEDSPNQLPTDCNARSSILSDTGLEDFSYQGCNYHKCGTVVNADTGSYNVSYCTDNNQGEGGCESTFLGCLPENSDPFSKDLDDGCMLIGGTEVCMMDDKNQCYEVDGVQKCFEQDSVCGVKNGSYQCVDNSIDNCGSFNGQTVCFKPNPDGTPSEEVIDPNSADHPDNGGNADGDDTNDIADSRPVNEGGDSNNQASDNKLTKKDAKKSLMDAQYLVNEQLKRGMWEGLPKGTAIEDSVKDSSELVADGLLESGQDIIDESLVNSQFLSNENAIDQLGSGVVGSINVGSTCSSIPLNTPGGTYYVDCFYLDKTREFLSYLFYFLTAWTLFTILTSPVESK